MDRFQDRYTASQNSGGEEAKITLKWYDPIKGFGFAQAHGHDRDVFIHASAVQREGNPALYPGAELTVEIGDSQRGKQVTRILEIHSVGDPEAANDRGGDRGPRGGDRGGRGGDRGPRGGDRGGFDRPAPAPYVADGSEVEMMGTLKWYKTQSGFGFASPADGSSDVFIHRSAMQRSGLDPHQIQPGASIKMLVRQAQKGPEAVQIELAS